MHIWDNVPIVMFLFGTYLMMLPKPNKDSEILCTYVSTLEYQPGKMGSWPIQNSEGPSGL